MKDLIQKVKKVTHDGGVYICTVDEGDNGVSFTNLYKTKEGKGVTEVAMRNWGRRFIKGSLGTMTLKGTYSYAVEDLCASQKEYLKNLADKLQKAKDNAAVDGVLYLFEQYIGGGRK